jgi:hypothetical protein
MLLDVNNYINVIKVLVRHGRLNSWNSCWSSINNSWNSNQKGLWFQDRSKRLNEVVKFSIKGDINNKK